MKLIISTPKTIGKSSFCASFVFMFIKDDIQYSALVSIRVEKVQVGNDQEKTQSETNSNSKNRSGKTLN